MQDTFIGDVEKLVENEVTEEDRRHSEFDDHINDISMNISNFFKESKNDLKNTTSSLKASSKISEETFKETNNFISNHSVHVDR